MDKKLLKSILLIITYAAVLVMVLARLDAVGAGIRTLLDVFKPLIMGFAIAFVLNRPCRFFLRLYDRALDGTRARGAASPLAVLSAYLVLILIIIALLSFVVPQLVASIQRFVGSLGGYASNLQDWINQLLERLHMEGLDLSGLSSGLKKLLDGVLELCSTLGLQLVQLAGSLFSAVVTGVLALVFSIYMLSGSGRLLRQCRRLLLAYVPPRFSGPILRVARLTADTFTNFVTGQLIEACILGGLCTVGMLFIQADYAALIGVIVGVSALIPVAGAYAGAIISALLLLMVSPFKAVTFLIFLVILQQIEGNVIYPRVVGTSIGLPGIWVLAAVTVGGGLFGLVGVVLSVPLASVVYTLLKRDVHRRLDSPVSQS